MSLLYLGMVFHIRQGKKKSTAPVTIKVSLIIYTY